MAAVAAAEPPTTTPPAYQRWVTFTFVLVACLLVLGFGIEIVHGALAIGDPKNCAGAVPEDAATGWKLVIASGAAFLLGHVLNHWRPVDYGQPQRSRWLPEGLDTKRLIHISLAALFGVGALLLFYEAIGLTGVNGLHPITHFVRCGKAQSARDAGFFSCGVTFLLGHWLWYPARGPE